MAPGVANVPDKQGAHASAPGATNSPSGHFEQLLLPGVDVVPAAQGVQDSAPPVENVLRGHAICAVGLYRFT